MSRIASQRATSPLAKEGFLCPICLQDQGDSNSLAIHFENAHSTDDSADVLQQVKGFFGKAKKFFTFEDDEEDNQPQQRLANGNLERQNIAGHFMNEDEYFETQEIGKTRDVTDLFKGIRDATVDRTVVECNKLVIRLAKLSAEDLPEDRSKRRALEQNIVSWAEDGSVKACSTCAKKFNITRRRHHCRLCGGIMCDKCSQFLPLSQARVVSNSVAGSEVTVSPPTFMKRSGSNSSINSLGTKEAEASLRMCIKCRQLIELHNSRQEQRSVKPTVVVLYEQLQRSRTKSESLRPDYVNIAFSLCSGETTHSLEKAEQMRQQLAKQYSEMEGISKRIVALKGTEDEPLTSTATKLQLHIRAYTISYIQDCSATLPTLPNQKQFEQLVKRKEEERKLKIQKQLELEKSKSAPPLPVSQAAPRVLEKKLKPVAEVSVGWKPGEVDSRQVQDDDPMVQQINIIRGYLKQAKQAQRYDEVEMLEDNLRHLEDEYYKQ